VADRDDAPDLVEVERYELFAGPAYRFEVHRPRLLQGAGSGLVVAFARPPRWPRNRAGCGAGRGPARRRLAWLYIGEDGRVRVYTGKAEVGQNIRTSLSQVVAEELRVPIASITMVMADTAVTPFDMGTFGSRTTPIMAAQLRKVAAAARELLIDLAAQRWAVDRGALVAQAAAVAHPPPAAPRATRAEQGSEAREGDRGRRPTAPAERWTVAGQSVPKVNDATS